MSRLQRIYDDQSQYYFITTKTYRNKKIFDNKRSVELLLQCINYLVKKKYFKLFAWVILPDHLHILLEIIGKKNISEVMHDFKSYTANQISKLILSRGAEASATMVRGKNQRPVGEASRPRLERNGRPKVMKIWQTSFYDHIIRNQDDLYTHLDYVHYNSIKHGYVTKPEDWPWSSYYSFLKRGYYKKGWGHGIMPENLSGIKFE